jgi:hypothetical protein
MRHLKTTLAVLGAVTILVLAGNTIALSATGHAFILGTPNSANAITKLTRTTSGPALNLTTRRSSNPPLVTNGTGKVTNLNADMVDGLDSSVLRTHSFLFTKDISVAVPSVTSVIPVPPGTYLFSYSGFLVGATGNVFCQIIKLHGSTTSYFAVTQFTAGSLTPGLSGSGMVTKASGDTLSFECGTAGTFTTQSNIPLQLVMTPTALSHTASLRTSAGVARHAAAR